LNWRHDLPWFQLQMAKKLGQPKNEAKDTYYVVLDEVLLAMLEREVLELRQALRHGSYEQVVEEAADVANFCMMIARNADRERERYERERTRDS